MDLSIKKYDVFITYRRSDGLSHAQLLYQALVKRGYRCFLDVRDDQDDEYEKRIMSALCKAPNYVFMMTEGSLQRLSEAGNNVYDELHAALRLHKKVIPVAPSGISRNLCGVKLLGEFSCLKALSVSRLETGEFLEESVDKIVQRFPVRNQHCRYWIVGVFLALIVASCTMLVVVRSKLHIHNESSRVNVVEEAKDNEDKNVEDGTVEPIKKRMQEIRLASVSFRPPATILDAIDFFRQASKDYDNPAIPYEQRGFNFILKHRKRSKYSADAAFGDSDSVFGVTDSLPDMPQIPVMPQISVNDITFYEALEYVCKCVGYKFVIQNGDILILPKDMPMEKLATWAYEVDDEFNKILHAWLVNDASTRDENLIFSNADDGNEICKIIKALTLHIGVTWYEDSGVEYITAINRLKVTNAPSELKRLERFLSDIKVLKAVQKNL